MPFAAQDIFANRYKLLQRNSVSDSIETWKAEDIKTKSSITLRFTNEAGNTVLNGLLLKEYLLLTQIRHHRLLMPLHFDEWENISYLVYPFPDGNSLKHNIQTEAFLNEEAGTKLFIALLEGVSVLHEEGIFHRNIQPANVFLIKQQYIIGQFKRQNEITLGQQQELLPYNAPELFSEQPEYVPESDLFSIAVVVYYGCTGILPWQGMGGLALLKGALVPKLPNTFSENFNKQLTACMAISAKDRPAIQQVINALNNKQPNIVIEAIPIIPSVTHVLESPVEIKKIPPKKEKKKHTKLVYALIILLLLFSTITIIFFHKNTPLSNTKVVAEKTAIVLDKKELATNTNTEFNGNEFSDSAQKNITTINLADTSTISNAKTYTYKKRKLTPFRNEAGLYGYKTGNTNVVITPLFDDVFEFSENMAAVRMKGLWGYIDTAGSWVITPQFITAGTFNNGMATVEKDGSNYTINTKGICVTGCSSISQQSF